MTTNHALTRRDLLRVATAAALANLATSSPSQSPNPQSAIRNPQSSASRYQLGCYTRPWAKFDYRVALDGIAEAGYKYAGLMTTNRQASKSGLVVHVDSTPEEVATIAAEVKKRGLKTLSIYGGDFHAAKSVEAGIAGLKKLVDYSAVCGCPNLLLGGTSDEKLVQPYYKVVAECCAYAASKGVGLSVKPHGGQNATGAQCRKLIETVGHPNFRLWYDAGNIYYYSDGKLDPVDDAPSVDGLVAGLSVKDFLPPKNVDLTPGTGQVKFREVLARLRQGGFTGGPLVVECLAPAGEPVKITAEAKTARQFLIDLVGPEHAE